MHGARQRMILSPEKEFALDNKKTRLPCLAFPPAFPPTFLPPAFLPPAFPMDD